MASKNPRYTLLATAGPDYNKDTHEQVVVNGETPLTIETEHAIVRLWVRIQGYKGLPHSSPSSHNYFSHPLHTHDQYSIAISFVPKQDVSGAEVVFGNDFPHPIRDRLPPGTSYALRFLKWWVDPGMESDPYADMPYLYGAALSSWNYFRICGMSDEEYSRPSSSSGGKQRNDGAEATRLTGEINGPRKSQDSARGSNTGSTTGSDAAAGLDDEVIQEGSEGSGTKVRAGFNVPDGVDARRRFFLEAQNRDAFVFEANRVYKADFGNPYLGFSDFTLRIPGFSIDVTNYIDKKNHELRHVLKNKKTGDIYFVLLFTLLLSEQQEETEENEDEEEEEEEEKEEQEEQGQEESEVD